MFLRIWKMMRGGRLTVDAIEAVDRFAMHGRGVVAVVVLVLVGFLQLVALDLGARLVCTVEVRLRTTLRRWLELREAHPLGAC